MLLELELELLPLSRCSELGTAVTAVDQSAETTVAHVRQCISGRGSVSCGLLSVYQIKNSARVYNPMLIVEL